MVPSVCLRTWEVVREAATTTCRAQQTKYKATMTRRTDRREVQRTSRDGKRSSEVDRTVDEVAAMAQRTVLAASHDDSR